MGIMAKGNVMLDGFIQVPPEHLDAVNALLKDHIRLTLAEPGCISFSVTPHPETKGRFVVSEVFEDQTAFDAHQKRAAGSEWGVFTKGFFRLYETRVLG